MLNTGNHSPKQLLFDTLIQILSIGNFQPKWVLLNALLWLFIIGNFDKLLFTQSLHLNVKHKQSSPKTIVAWHFDSYVKHQQFPPKWVSINALLWLFRIGNFAKNYVKPMPTLKCQAQVLCKTAVIQQFDSNVKLLVTFTQNEHCSMIFTDCLELEIVQTVL
jgi:hypothetical protein